KRFSYLELYAKTIERDPSVGQYFGNQAVVADADIKTLTRKYNQEIANGKWNYLMNEEPADNIFPSFRLSKPLLPIFVAEVQEQNYQAREFSEKVIYQAEDYSNKDWERYEGIGAIKALGAGAKIKLPVRLKASQIYCARVDIIPTFPDEKNTSWKITVKDANKTHQLEFAQSYNGKDWAQGVLNNYISATFEVQIKSSIENLLFISESRNLLLHQISFSPKRTEHCQ
ncbi:MAG: hypothetical protein ABW044_09195, partial [Cellvibrio sp.]